MEEFFSDCSQPLAGQGLKEFSGSFMTYRNSAAFYRRVRSSPTKTHHELRRIGGSRAPLDARRTQPALGLIYFIAQRSQGRPSYRRPTLGLRTESRWDSFITAGDVRMVREGLGFGQSPAEIQCHVLLIPNGDMSSSPGLVRRTSSYPGKSPKSILNAKGVVSRRGFRHRLRHRHRVSGFASGPVPDHLRYHIAHPPVNNGTYPLFSSADLKV